MWIYYIKKLYQTELSFADETKNNEIPNKLSKDDGFAWFNIQFGKP